MALFDAFLKMDGVTDNFPSREIELESFSWGVSNSATAGSTGQGGSAGKASFQDFSFTVEAGRQSPELFKAAFMGNTIQTAILTVNDKTEPIMLHFHEVIITSYKIDDGALHTDNDHSHPTVDTGAPIESVSFNFRSVDFSVGGNTTSGGPGGSTGGGKLL